MKKRKTVRRVLFGTYTVILVLSFFLLAAVLTVLQLSEIRSRTLTRLEQENRAAALSLNREIDQLRTMAMNISYSTRMQDRLLMPNASGEAEKLSKILSMIILPNRPIDQINIYTLDGMEGLKLEDLTAADFDTAGIIVTENGSVSAFCKCVLQDAGTDPFSAGLCFTGSNSAASRYPERGF